MLGVGLARNRRPLAPDANRRAVALLALPVGAVDLHQLREVHRAVEGVFNGREVQLVPVRGQLDSVCQAGSQVLYELRGAAGIPSPYQVGRHQLRLGIDGGEGPDIREAKLAYLVGRHGRGLRQDE